MKNEILYILLPDFASHKMVYLMEAVSSDEAQLKSSGKLTAEQKKQLIERLTATAAKITQYRSCSLQRLSRRFRTKTSALEVSLSTR